MNILSKMKKQGLPDKVLSFFKDSYLSVTKLRILDEDYRSEKHGSDFFYGSHVDGYTTPPTTSSDKEAVLLLKKVTLSPKKVTLEL